MDGTILCLVDSMRNVSWSHWRGLRNIMQRTRTCKEAARFLMLAPVKAKLILTI